MKELLIIGNGFDLSCGLASRYDDFFNWRMKKLFKTTDLEEIREMLEYSPKYSKTNSINKSSAPLWNETRDWKAKTNPMYSKKVDYSDKFLMNKLEKWQRFKGLTRWDVFFIYAQKYLKDNGLHEWEDIENIINNVVSIALEDQRSGLRDTPISKSETNLHFKDDSEDNFKDVVHKYANCENPDPEAIAYTLLNDLMKFEHIFSKYIYLQLDMFEDQNFNLPYFKNAEQLLRTITGYEDSNAGHLRIDIFSFNYTLGPRFKEKINDEFKSNDANIRSWNNIHGLACYNDPNAETAFRHEGKIPAPIFGIDSEDILNGRWNSNRYSARVLFTKPYRLVVNKTKNIRQNYNLKDIDEIIVYGHSLGQADYSYFKYIFDQCGLYQNNVNLLFYYWPGSNDDIVYKQKNERKYTEKVVNLLNRYGRDSDLTRSDIVTKLALQGRLTVLPNPKILGYHQVKKIS